MSHRPDPCQRQVGSLPALVPALLASALALAQTPSGAQATPATPATAASAEPTHHATHHAAHHGTDAGATHPTDPRAGVRPLHHRSTLQARTAPVDTPTGDWRAANEQVMRVGGWKAYLKQVQAPEGAR
ncbi:hypothetical protein C7444_10556 [Sphaerotilus hippei]|uniref:Uncharacterized protein n=1 Tax=Sphaerotilus hippei TaxID=744406 RepID=A0A318H2E5_9BURK|nr:hypothetical protein [Sphaerotilus hippei]PXW96959.1 hypothetical protein C7444_10556 [Sphaerotilus hippei]